MTARGPGGSASTRWGAGFTLLELMVVLVIIAVVFSVAVLAMPTRAPTSALQEEGERLVTLLRMAEEEAIVRSAPFGIGFDLQGYRFFMQRNGSWAELGENGGAFRPRAVPEDIEYTLFVEGVETVLEARDQVERPQVFILASGEYLPAFELELRMPFVGTPETNLRFVTLDEYGLPVLQTPDDR